MQSRRSHTISGIISMMAMMHIPVQKELREKVIQRAAALRPLIRMAR